MGDCDRQGSVTCVVQCEGGVAEELPEDEGERVHVGALEVEEEAEVEGAGEDLGRHVALGAGADGVGRERDAALAVAAQRQAQVADAAGQVGLHQHVLRLEVAVGEGRLAQAALHRRVQVVHAAHDPQRHPQRQRRRQANAAKTNRQLKTW